ncbi:MAG: polyprenyl synthetase family protein [Halorientalis sp.]
MHRTIDNEAFHSAAAHAQSLFRAESLTDEFEATLREQVESFHSVAERFRAVEALPTRAGEDILVLNAYMAYRRQQINEGLRRNVQAVANDSREAAILEEYVAGGERFAGILTYLAGEVFGTPEADLQRQAIIAELVMNSFLITDDVLDGHVERRGSDSIWYKMEQEYGFEDAAPFGIANLFQNKLVQRAFELAAAEEITHITGPINTAATGALTEAVHRHEGIDYLTHEEWRQFSEEVSSGLTIPFLLPAPDQANSHAVEELGRSFGLFEQTVDNAVDGQLPESMAAETEILRNAQVTLAATQQVDADTRLIDLVVPWFFYMYFYSHDDPEIDPEFLYTADLGVYDDSTETYLKA